MKRILGPGRWALHGSATSRLLERQALSNHPPHHLMRRAGLAVAQLGRALCPHGTSAWIAAGPGNNGGDGLEAGVQLQAAGWKVEMSLFGEPQNLPADARDALARARSAGIHITSRREVAAPDLAIDALLGLGSTRAPEGKLAEAVHDMNALPGLKLAVDLPSGLNPDTGQPWGGACISAHHTLALLTLKPGLFTGHGRDVAGSVWMDTLGIDVDAHPPDAWLGHAGSPPHRRRHAQHKGSFGDVAVVGGASGMAGAALLAARAAHAAGAGRVFVELLDVARPTHDEVRPELMLRAGWHRGASESWRGSTVVCGCGGGDAVRSTLPRLLSVSGRLVLDADALNAIATDVQLQQLLRARPPSSTVLTPHPLEAARLLGMDTTRVQSDRLGAAQELAERLACVVVLKGSGTVITAPGELPSINSTGNAALASAGTGDVLAGWIGGRWASSGADLLSNARQAVWLHGHCADIAQASPLRAADLIEAMHRAQARAAD